MNKKYLLKSPLMVGRLARLIAKSVDIFIVLILSVLLYPIGIILAMVYISVCDYIQSGQSVGKKLIGLSVISLNDGKPCNLRQSIVRNLPISVPLLFGVIPFWGWLFVLFIGVPVIGFEIYLLFKLDSGNRMGDVMADTTVMARNQGEQITKKTSESWFASEATLRSKDH